MSGVQTRLCRNVVFNGTKELTGYCLDQVEKWDFNTKVSQKEKNMLKLYKKTAYFVLL